MVDAGALSYVVTFTSINTTTLFLDLPPQCLGRFNIRYEGLLCNKVRNTNHAVKNVAQAYEQIECAVKLYLLIYVTFVVTPAG